MVIVLPSPRGSLNPAYRDGPVERMVDQQLYLEIAARTLVGQDANRALETAVWIGRALGKIVEANYLFRGEAK